MKVLQKIFSNFRKANKRKRGLTLLEVAIAITVAATLSLSLLGMISQALILQKKARNLELASSLARAKINQILSMPSLEPAKQSGEVPVSLYRGFTYEIEISEEQIDIAKLITETDGSNVSVDDLLPASVQNFKGRERAGQNTTETGGLLSVFRITIRIRYPVSKNRTETYEVQTFKIPKI